MVQFLAEHELAIDSNSKCPKIELHTGGLCMGFENNNLLSSEEAQLKADLEQLLAGLITREETTLRVIVHAMLAAGTPRFIEERIKDTNLRKAADCVARASRPVLVRFVSKWMQKNMAAEIATYLVAQLDNSKLMLDEAGNVLGEEEASSRLSQSTSVLAQAFVARNKQIEAERVAHQMELSATRQLARKTLIISVCCGSLLVSSLGLNAVFIGKQLMPPSSLSEHRIGN
jgi:hypothetical protein